MSLFSTPNAPDYGTLEVKYTTMEKQKGDAI